MSTTELLIILAMVVYAVYKQTQVHELKAKGRFKIAIIYVVVGLCVGGLTVPHSAWTIAFLALGLVFSAICGLARGRLTRIWVDGQGRIMARGTAVTVGLFLGLIALKFAMGTAEYFLGVKDAGFGDVLLMLGLMVAVQAEIVWQRARGIAASAPATVPTELTQVA